MKPIQWLLVVMVSVLLVNLGVKRSGSPTQQSDVQPGAAQATPATTQKAAFPRQIGSNSPKLKQKGNSKLLWAKGSFEGEDAEWFDVTDVPLEPAEFQFGIGKDTIPSIDNPTFVNADDPRLNEYHITDDSKVIGYVHEGEAKAYPIHILNQYELVNDRVGGKPVTVGW